MTTNTTAGSAPATRTMRPDRPPLGGCHRCGAAWHAMGAAHCTACCRHFSTARNFDRHRRSGQCIDPATTGLVNDGGVWREPSNPNRWTSEPGVQTELPLNAA